MNFFTRSGKPATQRTGCAIVGVYASGALTEAARTIDHSGSRLISNAIKRGDFRGDAGQTLLLPKAGRLGCERVLLVGVGPKRSYDRKSHRKALRSAVKALSDIGSRDAISYLAHESVRGADPYTLSRDAVAIVNGAVYRFTELKTKSRDKKRPALRRFGLAFSDRAAEREATAGVRDGTAIAAGTNLAKDLGNLPSNICTPDYLAETAKKIATRHKNVSVKILERAQVQRLGMGAFLSVTAGAEQPPKLIVIEYRGADKKTPPIALVGKGITFDTGGISLKPVGHIEDMKYDMCGAASVIGTLQTAAELKLELNVVGIVPACENKPDSGATNPGDVVTTMSGQTVEVVNTDAEGRLILCDALTYARRFEPRLIIDVATLTGACVVALGAHYSGLMSNDDELADTLTTAGDEAADPVCRLPLAEEYQSVLDTSVADFANIGGGRDAGAIVAACFLSRFTKGMRWAHLDVAGTAWRPDRKSSGTGRPVPLLVQFLLDEVSEAA